MKKRATARKLMAMECEICRKNAVELKCEGCGKWVDESCISQQNVDGGTGLCVKCASPQTSSHHPLSSLLSAYHGKAARKTTKRHQPTSIFSSSPSSSPSLSLLSLLSSSSMQVTDSMPIGSLKHKDGERVENSRDGCKNATSDCCDEGSVDMATSNSTSTPCKTSMAHTDKDEETKEKEKEKEKDREQTESLDRKLRRHAPKLHDDFTYGKEFTTPLKLDQTQLPAKLSSITSTSKQFQRMRWSYSEKFGFLQVLVNTRDTNKMNAYGFRKEDISSSSSFNSNGINLLLDYVRSPNCTFIKPNVKEKLKSFDEAYQVRVVKSLYDRLSSLYKELKDFCKLFEMSELEATQTKPPYLTLLLPKLSQLGFSSKRKDSMIGAAKSLDKMTLEFIKLLVQWKNPALLLFESEYESPVLKRAKMMEVESHDVSSECSSHFDKEVEEKGKERGEEQEMAERKAEVGGKGVDQTIIDEKKKHHHYDDGDEDKDDGDDNTNNDGCNRNDDGIERLFEDNEGERSLSTLLSTEDNSKKINPLRKQSELAVDQCSLKMLSHESNEQIVYNALRLKAEVEIELKILRNFPFTSDDDKRLVYFDMLKRHHLSHLARCIEKAERQGREENTLTNSLLVLDNYPFDTTDQKREVYKKVMKKHNLAFLLDEIDKVEQQKI
eukprot:m.77079 g.77079  ORF g.77079 m.77079 type:complete len:666 (-) comp8532_c0_seq5:108-2105(-)